MTHPSLVPVRDTALGRGLRELLAKLAARLDLDREVHVFLAGGMAVHLYLGKRVTSDVDAEFSARVLVPSDLIVDVVLEDGQRKALHFDTNYNSTFALMHEDYLQDSVPTDMSEGRLTLRVLNPTDLAVSKIARLAEVDRQDIRDLVRAGLTTPDAIEKRAREALVAYVGGQRMAALNLEDALKAAREGASPGSPPPRG